MNKEQGKRLLNVIKYLFILIVIGLIIVGAAVEGAPHSCSRYGTCGSWGEFWGILMGGLIGFFALWYIIKRIIRYIRHGYLLPKKKKLDTTKEIPRKYKQEEKIAKNKITIFKKLDRKYFPHIKNKEEKIEKKIIDELNYYLKKLDVDEKVLKEIIIARVKEFGYVKEDWQEHYAVDRIINGLKRDNDKKLGVWFVFYAYVRTTIGIIMGYANLKFYNQLLTDLEVDYIYIFINEIVVYTGIILAIILIAGLSQKSRWGFKYNKFYIICEWIWMAITFGIGNIIGGIMFFALWYPIWVRPNRIYFNNRKHLFRQ